MTTLKALFWSFLLTVFGIVSLAVEEFILPTQIHGPGHKIVRVKSDLASIDQAIQMYKLDNLTYPSTSQGLNALVEKPSGEPEPVNWSAGYLRALSNDPWKNSYLYTEANGKYSIYSAGKNGIDELREGDDVVLDSKIYSCATYGVNCPMHYAKLVSFCISSIGLIATTLLSIFIISRSLLRRFRSI